jgi:hypothetical protein
LPAGLLLLCQWRARYSRGANLPAANATLSKSETSLGNIVPFWVEVLLYATMPLFHLHTFMALSIVAAFLFFVGGSAMWKEFGALAAIAFLPATFFIWSITDHFKASSFLELHSGWVRGTDDFAPGFFQFWFENFGIFIPVVLFLIAVLIWRARQSGGAFKFREHPSLVFLAPAALIFFFAYFVKTAPWGWDNIKLIIWAYLIVLPFLWKDLIGQLPTHGRLVFCFGLFASGFISLFGGLLTPENGYGFADRAEFDAVGSAIRKLPAQARFAAYPTYNHPLLLQGRKLVLGYPGHLWTQGFKYTGVEKRLVSVMQGAPDWKQQARDLRTRYLFWGREEIANYPESKRPWEREATKVASGSWGAIYDLERPADSILER